MEQRHGARQEGIWGRWGVWGRRDLSPLICNLSTRWRWVLKFMPWSLYPAEGATVGVHWIGDCVDPETFRRFGEESSNRTKTVRLSGPFSRRYVSTKCPWCLHYNFVLSMSAPRTWWTIRTCRKFRNGGQW